MLQPIRRVAFAVLPLLILFGCAPPETTSEPEAPAETAPPADTAPAAAPTPDAGEKEGEKDETEYPPSPGAQGMAGATGTFEFKPDDWQEGTTSWWKDSDGVDPGTPGCHIGTDAEGQPNGRMFGEACLPDGQLVESNPGIDELHSHANDVGHPDRFDCNAWCVGEGATGGVCSAAPAPPCDASALCACE